MKKLDKMKLLRRSAVFVLLNLILLSFALNKAALAQTVKKPVGAMNHPTTVPHSVGIENSHGAPTPIGRVGVSQDEVMPAPVAVPPKPPVHKMVKRSKRIHRRRYWHHRHKYPFVGGSPTPIGRGKH